MKATLLWRLVFGLSAVLFGVIALVWHDADTWQSLTPLWKLPFGTVVGSCLMIVQIAGGAGLLLPQTTRPASLVLVAVYGIFSLTCIPGIIAAPKEFGQYDGFFEQFSLLCGAIAAYAVSGPRAARSLTLARVVRIGLGLCAVSFTLAQVVYLQFTASLVPTWIPPDQMFWAILTTVLFGLAAIAILINVRSRLAMRLMALMMALFGVLIWVSHLIAHPQSHLNWSEFTITFLITGAALSVADLSGDPDRRKRSTPPEYAAGLRRNRRAR